MMNIPATYCMRQKLTTTTLILLSQKGHFTCIQRPYQTHTLSLSALLPSSSHLGYFWNFRNLTFFNKEEILSFQARSPQFFGFPNPSSKQRCTWPELQLLFPKYKLIPDLSVLCLAQVDTLIKWQKLTLCSEIIQISQIDRIRGSDFKRHDWGWMFFE